MGLVIAKCALAALLALLEASVPAAQFQQTAQILCCAEAKIAPAKLKQKEESRCPLSALSIPIFYTPVLRPAPTIDLRAARPPPVSSQRL